jgi:putative component of membrane protein insertase Oxa1/YidC/SpoIIIJ protein YidD
MRIYITILFLISIKAQAQSKEDLALTSPEYKTEQTKKVWLVAKNNKGVGQKVVSFLFLGYKAFLSSQDASRCGFSPSCSEYAVLSVKRFGLIVGVMSAFDRLSRCNGLSPELYDYDEDKNLLIDKPE